MIRKQKLKEWQRRQKKGNSVEKPQDDYIPTPMEVETVDSAGKQLCALMYSRNN